MAVRSGDLKLILLIVIEECFQVRHILFDQAFGRKEYILVCVLNYGVSGFTIAEVPEYIRKILSGRKHQVDFLCCALLRDRLPVKLYSCVLEPFLAHSQVAYFYGSVCRVYDQSGNFSVFLFEFCRIFDDRKSTIELDDSLEAYAAVTLVGADNAARQGETNLGDLWADALRWFAVSGEINAAFDEDDVKAGNDRIAVDADHVVALWNGGNLRADIAEGTFGAEALAEVLPFPNKVAVVYMTGAQLLETLEAASQGLPYTAETADACASLMQVSGLTYTVDTTKAYDALEAYGDHWFTAGSVSRVRIDDVNGQPFDAEATYAVVTSNANFNGMDSSYVLKAAAEANEQSAVTTAVVRDVVFRFIAAELNHQVGEAYAAPQGRLTIL